jgi:hypothetical protein
MEIPIAAFFLLSFLTSLLSFFVLAAALRKNAIRISGCGTMGLQRRDM